MKKLVVVFFLAAMPFNFSVCQNLDSLILSTVYIEPGDTAVLTLSLHNQSFDVGAFSAKLILADSSKARFIEVQRGVAVTDFAVFLSSLTNGSIRITGIANWPNYDPAPPLPLGTHEIAIVKVAVDDTVSQGSQITISFDRSVDMLNMISDTSGYETAEPMTINGTIIIGSANGIEQDIQTPVTYVLENNYPNPFNAGTNIGFSIREPGFALLKIYDILGRKVAVLFERYVPAGTYNVAWDGKSDTNQPLSSGMYFYRLIFNGSSITKKMSMVK